jgi:hypothetical protein
MNFKQWYAINETTSESDLTKAIDKVKSYLDPSADSKQIDELDKGFNELIKLKDMDVVPNSELKKTRDKFSVQPTLAINVHRAISTHILVPLPYNMSGGLYGLHNKDNPTFNNKPNPFYQTLGTTKFENWNKYNEAFFTTLWSLSVQASSEKLAKQLKKYSKYANDFPYSKPLDQEKPENWPDTEALINIPLKSGKEVALADWMEDAGKLYKTLSDFIKDNIQHKTKKDADIKKEKKEQDKQEKIQAKKTEDEKVRAATPPISFQAAEKMQKQIEALLQKQKEEYMADFLEVAHDQVDDFINSMPKTTDTSSQAYERAKHVRSANPIANRIVKSKPDGSYEQPSEEDFQKAANESWRNVSSTFFYRITHKLTPIVMAKAAQTGQPANIQVINATTRYGTLEVMLKVTFSDNSSFIVNHKMVAAISSARRGAWFSTGGGKRFYRFPTTFHDVIMPDGKKMKLPSANSVYTDFAGTKPPEAIESDEETEVQD